MNNFSDFQYYINNKSNHNAEENCFPMTLTECGTMSKITQSQDNNNENKFKELSKYKEFNCLKNNSNKESIFNYEKLKNNKNGILNYQNQIVNKVNQNYLLNNKNMNSNQNHNSNFNHTNKNLFIKEYQNKKSNNKYKEIRDFSKFVKQKKINNLNNSDSVINYNSNNIFSNHSNYSMSNIFIKTNNNLNNIFNKNKLHSKNISSSKKKNKNNLSDLFSNEILNSGKKILNKRNFENIKLKPKKTNIYNNEKKNILSNQQNSITPVNNQTILQYDSSKLKSDNYNKNFFERIQNNKNSNLINTYFNNSSSFDLNLNISNNNFCGEKLFLKQNYINQAKKCKEDLKIYFNQNSPFCKKLKKFIDYNELYTL